MSDLSYKAVISAALAFALLTGAAPTARAAENPKTDPTTDPATDPTTKAAREHHQKGASYYDLGRYPEAIREFEAAYELKNDPALLYNLAQSHRLAGNSDQALHFYRTYLRRMPKAANRTEIEGRIAALEQLVAQKSATQSTPPNQTIPPPGSAGAVPPVAPEALPPGAPGSGASSTPSASGGVGTAPPPMNPPPLQPGPGNTGQPPGATWPAQPPPADVDPGKKLRTIGTWVAIGGGVLFLFGMIEGGRAVGAANEINDAAKAGRAFDPAIESRGKSAERAEVFLLVTGTLAAAGGGALYYYGRRKTEQAAAAPPPMISMTPVVSATGAGALLRVTF